MAESTTENPTTMAEEHPTASASAMTTTTTEQQSTETLTAATAPPPTKSNNTTTSTTTTSSDFEPPAACIRRLLKQTLPKSTNISKDSLSALSRASGIFILYLTACANDVAREGRRTTIVAKDVIGALKELDFEEFVPAMEKFLEGHRREERSKKEEKERMKQRSASLDGSVGGVVEKRDKGGKFVSGSLGGGKGDEGGGVENEDNEEEEHDEVKNDNMDNEEAVKLLGEQKQNEEHKISPAVNAADASSGEKHPRQEEEKDDNDDEGKSLPSKKQRMEGEE